MTVTPAGAQSHSGPGLTKLTSLGTAASPSAVLLHGQCQALSSVPTLDIPVFPGAGWTHLQDSELSIYSVYSHSLPKPPLACAGIG